MVICLQINKYVDGGIVPEEGTESTQTSLMAWFCEVIAQTINS